MIIVEDNFYDDPEEVYQKAISIEYNSGEKEGGHAGQRSIERYYEEVAMEKISRLLKVQLYSNSPDNARAVTISGEPTKAYVFGFPSARFAKFLLNE